MKIVSKDKIRFFKNHEILRFESVNDKTLICFINGRSLEIDNPLDNIEAQLKKSGFIRIHDSHIVNVNYIARIAAGTDDFVEMSNAEVLPIETGQKQIIVELLANHFNNQSKT